MLFFACSKGTAVQISFDERLGNTNLSPFSFSSSSKYENSLHESKSYLRSETCCICNLCNDRNLPSWPKFNLLYTYKRTKIYRIHPHLQKRSLHLQDLAQTAYLTTYSKKYLKLFVCSHIVHLECFLQYDVVLKICVKKCFHIQQPLKNPPGICLKHRPKNLIKIDLRIWVHRWNIIIKCWINAIVCSSFSFVH